MFSELALFLWSGLPLNIPVSKYRLFSNGCSTIRVRILHTSATLSLGLPPFMNSDKSEPMKVGLFWYSCMDKSIIDAEQPYYWIDKWVLSHRNTHCQYYDCGSVIKTGANSPQHEPFIKDWRWFLQCQHQMAVHMVRFPRHFSCTRSDNYRRSNTHLQYFYILIVRG